MAVHRVKNSFLGPSAVTTGLRCLLLAVVVTCSVTVTPVVATTTPPTTTVTPATSTISPTTTIASSTTTILPTTTIASSTTTILPTTTTPPITITASSTTPSTTAPTTSTSMDASTTTTAPSPTIQPSTFVSTTPESTTLVSTTTTLESATLELTTLQPTTPTTSEATTSADPIVNLTCSPNLVRLELSEGTDADVCLLPVGGTNITCTHTGGVANFPGTVAFAKLGVEDDLFTVTKVSLTAQGSFGVEICVNHTAFDLVPGSYQWFIVVTFAIGRQTDDDSIEVNVIVLDENEAPVIDVTVDSVTVWENASIDFVIFTFNVTDPDAIIANGSAAYKNITNVSLVLGVDDVLLSGPAPLQLQEVASGQYQVVVTQRLNASDTATYLATITATDGGGLATSVNVTVDVADINEPPQCASNNVTVHVNLLTSVGTLLGRLECWDPDVTSTFNVLQFSPQTLFALMDIGPDGNITLTTAVARDTVAMETVVSVYAPRFPDVSTTVTVSLQVSENPPDCSGTQDTVSFPDSAPVGYCSNVTVCCTTAGSDALLTATNSTSGPVAWAVSQGDPSTDSTLDFAVCVTDVLFHLVGQYQVSLNVSNSTGTTSVTWTVTIDDVNQPPEFLNEPYAIQVSESTATQQSVAQVTVVTDRSAAAMLPSDVIVVWDPDNVTASYQFSSVSFNGATLLYHNSTKATVTQPSDPLLPIELLTASGPPYVLRTISALPAGLNISFGIRAEDGQGSSANTTVVFTVSDVNQKPDCGAGSQTLTLDLVTSVGTPLFTLPCTDNDVNVTLSTLTYSEYTTSNFDFACFSVNDSGVVTLQQLVPIDVSTMTYKVHVIDGGGLAANFTINFNINRDFPPSCTPPSPIDVTFRETDTSGTCTQTLVTCSDTSGRGLAMAVSVVSDAIKGEIRVADKPVTNTLALEACSQSPVNSQRLTVGNFEVVVDVNNSLAVTRITFNVTVIDENQAPYFEFSKYNVSVPEDVGVGNTLAVVISPTDAVHPNVVNIVRDDPDTVTSDFMITSLMLALSVDYENGTGYEVDVRANPPITMVRSAVVVAAALRTDLIYKCFLTVTDGQGLFGNTTFVVTVTDINEAPSCQPVSPIDLDLLASAPSVVYTLTCTDLDHDNAFRSLRYFSYPLADYSFFDVSETSGDIKLSTSLPRDATSLVLEAYAIDGGGLRDNVTLDFNISRDHPPDCFPSYVPPSGVWDYDTCFRVYPNCSDPSTSEGNKTFLFYTFTGSWLKAFRQTVLLNASNDFAEFCYFLRTDGNFKIRLVVDNGLGTFTWEEDIIVSYRDAPPRFVTNRYIATVNETAPVGFPVQTVEALVDGQNASLVYSFTGNFGKYFAIGSNNGSITVAGDLSPLVNTDAKTYVTATDPQSGLNHSVPLTVKVEDINQPPTCYPALLSVAVLWNVTVNDTVATVNCTDLDPSPGFSTLTYRVDSGSAVWRSDLANVRLISRALLDPSQSLHVLTVVASDGVFAATATVTLTIDRTPPAPVLRVTAVGMDNASVAWSFPANYLPVINGFALVTTTASGGSPLMSVLPKDRRAYVITGLTPEVSYTVNVSVRGLARNVTSGPASFRTSPVPRLQQSCVEVRLQNESWTPSLLDIRSAQFAALSNNLSSGVHSWLNGRLRGYVRNRVRSFRLGSVLPDMVITTNQSLASLIDLKLKLIDLINTGSIGGVPVNRSYFRFYVGGQYIAETSLNYVSLGKITDPVVQGLSVVVDGYDVTATCSARTPGVSNPTFDWTLNGRDVSAMTTSGRYSVDERRDANDLYRVFSTVTVRHVLSSESGILLCVVTAANKTDSKQVRLEVVTRLTTFLSPPTAMVTSGSDVTLTCARMAGYKVEWQAVLYSINSQNVEVEVTSVNKSRNDTQAVFVVPAVTSDVTYKCEVRDSLVSVKSNKANIIIQVPETLRCSADGGWPETQAGNTVQRECPAGYVSGSLQKRTCSMDGEWSESDTSSCVKQDLKDLQTTMDQIQENTTNSTTGEVVRMLANSTSGPLLLGDVTTAVDILEGVVKVKEDRSQAPDEDELLKFVESADNVLHAPTDVWQNQTPLALSLVHAVDKMGKASSKGLNASVKVRQPISTNKIVLQVGRSSREDIQFPIPDQSQNYPAWVLAANNSVFLSKDAFHDNVTEVKYSAVIYRNLSNVFSEQFDRTLTGSNDLSINSAILALSLAISDPTIRQSILLTFDHITSNFSSTSCQFLNFSASAAGMWSSNGCRVVQTDSVLTKCECDHLTNFAVLISPYRPDDVVADVLSIFSIVGCSVSIFCLLLTLVVYFALWRYVKSDRSVLLVNLCIVLILAYVTFLAGVNRVEHKIACTVVAALLHYLWLVVFFLMLCEGLDIFISIVIVFPIKSVLKWFLFLAYGGPLVVVGASLGITQLEGYGGPDFCWLSLKDGLLWAFVGPALAALLANFVFVALVIRALLSTTSMITKVNRERAKSILKAISVMTPILGLAWIFGVLAVNEYTSVFQILFVVFNSLQGLMIFIFHCVLSKQVREGLQNRRRRYKAKSSTAEESSGKYATQKQGSDSTAPGNDLDKKTTSPFLLVDRQVQEMASKVARLGGHNLLTSDDPPKDVALKNPVAGTTDESSEHYFNILNESTTDDLENDKEAAVLSDVEPEFKIEAGNLTSFKPSSPTTTTAKPTTTTTTTSTTTAAKEEGPAAKQPLQMGSLEDNETQKSNQSLRAPDSDSMGLNPAQTVLPQQIPRTSQTDRSSGSGGSRGSKQSDRRQTGGNSKERMKEREKSQKAAAKVFEQEEHQKRLDHVYGAGARISDDGNTKGGHYVKGPSARPARSHDDIPMTTAPKNPVYFDVVPALTPTDRWVRAAQASKQQPRNLQPLSASRHAPRSAPFYNQPRPTSPRRMATSAESLGSAQFQPFSAPRSGDGRRGNRRGPPGVAPKPSRWHQEPPVDYW